MAAGTTPIFYKAPKVADVQISTANTNRDGSGTLGTILTAGADGSGVDRITIIGVGTITAGMIRFFESTDGGTTKRLIREVPVQAVTPSGTVAGFLYVLANGDGSPWWVGNDANSILYCSTHNAETFNVQSIGGTY